MGRLAHERSRARRRASVTTTAKARGSTGRNGSSTAASPGTLKEELVAYLRRDREELRGEWVRAMAARGDLGLDYWPAGGQDLGWLRFNTLVSIAWTLGVTRVRRSSRGRWPGG